MISVTGLRLVRLYLLSRRVPAALGMLVVCAAGLHLILHWTPTTGDYARQLPLIIVAAAAAVVGAGLRSPFDEAERATGLRLPVLRGLSAVGLVAAGFGALAAGAVGARLSGGAVGLLRDLAGLVGVTLIAAVFGSGGLAWMGTIGYLCLAVAGIGLGWTTPWLWPARPVLDTGAALSATAALVVGLLAVVFRGTRESPVLS
jgi:hypothetical protein